jgi:hypothetical protein
MCKYLFLVVLMAASAIPCDADSLFTLIPGPDLTGPAGSTLTWELESSNSDSSLFLEVTGVVAASFDGSEGYDDSFASFTYPVLAPGTPIEIDPFYSLTWAPNAVAGYGFSGDFTITSQYCIDNVGDGCGNSSNTLVPYSASVTESGAPEPGTLALLGLGLLGTAFRRRIAAGIWRNPAIRIFPSINGSPACRKRWRMRPHSGTVTQRET